ncbi:hypothetical protein N431DRAFT_467068 [Stipitochalara longipes BDJ]|nr:hypothetical protein N431DRAFT_467068 [Stipitochalara longipes BDJ]
MVYPEQQHDILSMEEFEGDFEADYGISSKNSTGEPLSASGSKSAPEISEVRNQSGASDEKPSVEYIEDIQTPYWDTKNVVGAVRNLSPAKSSSEKIPARAGFWQRRRQHYRRYWILYTIGVVISLAILLPIVFLVVFPAIAQRLVDNASLPIYSASIMHPTPSSVVYSLSSSLKIPNGLTVDLKPITLNLFTKDSGPADPYIKVNLPEYHLRGETKINITGQTVDILDQHYFEEFMKSAVDNKEFTLSASGATTAYLGALKAPIKLNKDVKLPGLDNLAGFEFASAAIVFPPDQDGTNLVGNVTLPNPTVISLELGNVTLNMIVGNVTMGQGRIENVFLVPGNNTVPIRATFDIKTAIQNLGVILQAESDALTRGNVVISASGNSTIYNGVHIPYYEAILNNIFVTGEMPLIKILVDTLEQGLSTNNSLISSILTPLGGLSGLSSLLGGLTGTSTLSS